MYCPTAGGPAHHQALAFSFGELPVHSLCPFSFSWFVFSLLIDKTFIYILNVNLYVFCLYFSLVLGIFYGIEF